MFARVAQKLAPTVGRSTTTSVTSMMSSLSLAPRSFLAVQSPMNSGVPLFMSTAFGSRTSTLTSAVSIQPIFQCGLRNNLAFANSLVPGSMPAPLVTSGLQQVRGFASKKHKRVIKQSKGFRGRANRCYRVAIRRLEKSWQYAYRDRKVKKREFRKLWIMRLNAGVRQQGLSYSNFIAMQNKSGVTLDRKILSDLAMYEPFSFKAVVDVVKKMSA